MIPHDLLEFGVNIGILNEILLGILSSLPDLLTFVGIPGTGLNNKDMYNQ